MTRERDPSNLVGRRRRDESGDTLIEVLIAIVIISLSVVAVLGTLTETITSSAEHRSLTTLDSVLKNFAEAAKYDVQLQPAASSIYQDCAGQQSPSIPVYRVVSTYPSTAAVGTGVTVFGTNFSPGATVSVTVGATAVPAANFASGSKVNSDGTVAASFKVPTTATGSQAVSVSDGTNSAVSATALSVTPSSGSSAGSPVAGYSISISSIGWWNSSTNVFDNSTTSTCTANDRSGIQEVNLIARAPSRADDTLSVVVTNPAFIPPNPAPAVSVVASPPTPTAGQTIVFSANFTGSTGGTWPSGQVDWTFTNSPGNPMCAPSSLNKTGTNTSTTSCTVASALPGIYQVAATYSGDVNYSATAGYGSVTVPKSTPTVSVSVSPAHPVVGQTLTFTATITGTAGITPGGTVSWGFTVPAGGTAPTCPTNVTGSGNTVTNSCLVPNSVAGTYTGTATYSGDTNYQPGNAQASTTVHMPLTITKVQLINGGTTAGKIEKGDSVAITFSSQMSVSSMCSTWSGDANVQNLNANNDVTVMVAAGATNTLTVASGTCTFNLGSIALGSGAYATSTVTFKGSGGSKSTINWTPATLTLTIVLGGASNSSVEGTVATSTPVYTASAALTDSFGDQVSNSPFTLPAGKQF